MLLAEWDIKVRPHLHAIEAGAEMALRHTRQLVCKPEFLTLSEAELGECRRVLQAALADIVAAQTLYVAKHRESEYAAS